MAPENEGTEQSPPSDVELLGFDPESAGTTLESEMKRVEALKDAPDSESQAQEREGEAKPADDPASQADDSKEKAETASEAEKKGAAPEVEKVETVEGGFTFNGKTYKTEGEANHAQSSYRGQLKSFEKRTQEAEKEAATAKAELAESKRLSQTPAKPDAELEKPASEGATKEKGLDDFVNWETYHKLYEDPDYGPASAQRYVSLKNQEYLDAMSKGLEEKFEKALTKRFEPVEVNEQARVEFEEAVGHFTELSEREDDDGQKLFPEIQPDTGDVDFITRVAVRYNSDAELKGMGSYGVYLSLLAERDWEKFNVPAVEKGKAKVPEKPEEEKSTKASEALTQFNKEHEAAKSGSVVPDGGGTPRLKPGSAGRKAGTWQDEVMSGLERAADDQEDKMVLGF